MSFCTPVACSNPRATGKLVASHSQVLCVICILHTAGISNVEGIKSGENKQTNNNTQTIQQPQDEQSLIIEL